jgi:DNA-binding transcriptional LysR family regulator
MRLAWRDGVQDARGAGSAARTARIGIQHDLLGDSVADWVTVLQEAMPQTALYVEADYSAQMCTDVASGALDLAIFYTPKPHPDLHFETLGEIAYVMVSTEAERLTEVRADSYILANFAPAFTATHAALLPALSVGAVSSGQNAVVRGLLIAFGGSTYVLRQTALELGRAGVAQRVSGAPVIAQPVYACVHLRNRHRRPYQRALHALRAHLQAGQR